MKTLTSAMDNLDAGRLGDIALAVERTPREKIGDSIDRGLILLRLLNEKGYGVVKLDN